jgi:signal transduction histidine kinase
MNIKGMPLYRFNILSYFRKENQQALSEDRKISESYFINFSFICIIVLTLFTITNALAKFWEAVIINALGTLLFVGGLFLYKKTISYHTPIGILICTCSSILVGQHVILEMDAYHNMFFFPALSVFTFALVDTKKLVHVYLGFIVLSALSAHFVVKNFGTTVKTLPSSEKDMYFVLTVIASVYATYRVVKTFHAQRQEAYLKLNDSYEKNKELNDKYKQLLSVLTHDIANPLSVIRTSVHLLQKNHSDQESFNKFIERYTRSEKLIIDIIDKSRQLLATEDGKLVIHLEKINFKSLLFEVISNFKQDLEKKSIQVEVSDINENLLILADETALKLSVLSNLISNSIKFSANGKKIEIIVIEKKGSIDVQLKDYGVGMPADLLKNIFNPRVKTTRLGTNGEPGTGYGMPLAYAYVQEMGSELSCHSIEGVGTTFCFSLKKA